MAKNISLCGFIGLVCVFVLSLPLYPQVNSTVEITNQDITEPQAQPPATEIQPQTIEEQILSQVSSYLKPSSQAEYRISTGDTLDISVWQVPDLSRPDVIVRPDGKISYPLIGDVPAQGLSLTQLDEILTERLKRYVKDPQVSVMLRSMARVAGVAGVESPIVNKFVILGEIGRPGVYSYSGDIRIIEALALAGGVTDDSVRGDIVVIRGKIDSPETCSVNIRRILKKHHPELAMNIPLQPDDIILVPRTFIANVNAFVRTMYPLLSFARDGMTARNAIPAARDTRWTHRQND